MFCKRQIRVLIKLFQYCFKWKLIHFFGFSHLKHKIVWLKGIISEWYSKYNNKYYRSLFLVFYNDNKLSKWPKLHNKKYFNAFEILKRINYVLIDWSTNDFQSNLWFHGRIFIVIVWECIYFENVIKCINFTTFN